MSDEFLYNEKGLLLQVAEGNENAFRQLFNAYRKKLYSYVLKVTRSPEMAEDAVQEIFLKVWDKREKLSAVDNINAYLHRMAHNYSYDGFKQVAKEALVLSNLRNAFEPDYRNPADELISKEVKVYIQGIVDRLTPQQRQVYLLSREGGLKHSEIAERMNISVLTVKKHIGDALHFLRTEIGEGYGSQAIALYVIYQLTLY